MYFLPHGRQAAMAPEPYDPPGLRPPPLSKGGKRRSILLQRQEDEGLGGAGDFSVNHGVVGDFVRFQFLEDQGVARFQRAVYSTISFLGVRVRMSGPSLATRTMSSMRMPNLPSK